MSSLLSRFMPVSTAAFTTSTDTGASSPSAVASSGWSPDDATRPSASLYRAQAVAVKVAESIPAVRKALHVITGTPSTFALAGWQGNTRLDELDPRCAWLRQPDPYRTRQWIIGKTLRDGVWHDRSVWRILDRTVMGQPVRFQRIHPSRVDVVQDPHDEDVVDTWVIDGTSYTNADVRRQFVVFDFGGLGGLKRYGAPLLGLYADLQAAAGNYARAPHPKAILKNHGPDLLDDEIDDLLAEWDAARAGSSTAYLNDTMDYETVGWNPEELQLVEAREHTATEVARLFGLPANAIDAKSGASMTYGNIVEWRKDLLEALRPWMSVITQTLSLDDRTSTPRGLVLPYGIRAEFDADAYTRDDPATRMTTWADALSNNILTLDEVRAAEPLARS